MQASGEGGESAPKGVGRSVFRARDAYGLGSGAEQLGFRLALTEGAAAVESA